MAHGGRARNGWRQRMAERLAESGPRSDPLTDTVYIDNRRLVEMQLQRQYPGHSLDSTAHTQSLGALWNFRRRGLCRSSSCCPSWNRRINRIRRPRRPGTRDSQPRIRSRPPGSTESVHRQLALASTLSQIARVAADHRQLLIQFHRWSSDAAAALFLFRGHCVCARAGSAAVVCVLSRVQSSFTERMEQGEFLFVCRGLQFRFRVVGLERD